MDLMKRAIDSERGRELCGGRFATKDPMFGNICHNKRLNRCKHPVKSSIPGR